MRDRRTNTVERERRGDIYYVSGLCYPAGFHRDEVASLVPDTGASNASG